MTKWFYKTLSSFQTSIQVLIDNVDFLSYITFLNLHSSEWRDTTNTFILRWCDKIRVYESLVSISDHFTNIIKLIMLKNSVAGISDLNEVKV